MPGLRRGRLRRSPCLRVLGAAWGGARVSFLRDRGTGQCSTEGGRGGGGGPGWAGLLSAEARCAAQLGAGRRPGQGRGLLKGRVHQAQDFGLGVRTVPGGFGPENGRAVSAAQRDPPVCHTGAEVGEQAGRPGTDLGHGPGRKGPGPELAWLWPSRKSVGLAERGRVAGAGQEMRAGDLVAVGAIAGRERTQSCVTNAICRDTAGPPLLPLLPSLYLTASTPWAAAL